MIYIRRKWKYCAGSSIGISIIGNRNLDVPTIVGRALSLANYKAMIEATFQYGKY